MKGRKSPPAFAAAKGGEKMKDSEEMRIQNQFGEFCAIFIIICILHWEKTKQFFMNALKRNIPYRKKSGKVNFTRTTGKGIGYTIVAFAAIAEDGEEIAGVKIYFRMLKLILRGISLRILRLNN